MLKSAKRASVVLFALLFLPSMLYAQGAITGVVKDTSGGVLPGVTVEAASPVLIEKVRSVISDATGQYRIVNLLPGTYSVTFSLAGFGTVRREGIELTGTFVATVNGDLKVGALEETVTVTGESPIVDVQSSKVQQTVSKEILAAIPTARTAVGIQALVPGIIPGQGGLDVGGASGGFGGTAGAIHGGRPNDSRSMNDGLSTGYNNGGGGGGNNANVAGAQEVVITTSGGLGEAETAGVVVNLIPRDGSNTFSGTFNASGANGAMQSSNYSQELKDRGLKAPPELLKVFDVNPMGGGRIIRDRLWFYLTGRYWGADNTVAGMWVNKNAGNPNAWVPDFDLSRQAFSDIRNATAIGRLTLQASPRNKVTAYWSEQYNCDNCVGGGADQRAPVPQTIEATGQLKFHPSHVQQATWSSPVTSRLLMEAGFGTYLARYGNPGGRTDGTHNDRMIRVIEQAGSIPGLAYRMPEQWMHHLLGTRTWRASASYVTGAHNMKFGYFGGFSNPSQHYSYYDNLIAYRFNNTVPNRLSVTGVYPGAYSITRNLVPVSLYAQDQWTTGQLTLQWGVRYDRMMTSYPDTNVYPTPLIPAGIYYPARSTPGIKYDDISPRIGTAYDLFGNGKTALKVNIGKYMQAVQGSFTDLDMNPIIRTPVSTTRSWTDSNSNYVPECNLANQAKNGECGAAADQNFGKKVFSRTFDPGYVTGWNNRTYNWELGVSVQQELAPRFSVNVGYFRRWFGNWYAVDNRSTNFSDYTPFSIVVPVDARLPNGGGQTISGLYNLVPEKVGQIDELAQASTNFGEQTERWSGVDVNFNARLRNGLTVQGGTSTGRAIKDGCEVRAKVPEFGTGADGVANSSVTPVSVTNPWCRVVEPFITRATGLATYTIPRVDLQVSGTWQSNPGPQLAANYNVPNAVVAPSLGRSLSGGAANVTVPLYAPGQVYGDRINQIDFRVAKILRFGRTRTQIGLDLYNAANRDTPTTYNQTFVPNGQWLTPTNVLTARFLKVSAQFDF